MNHRHRQQQLGLVVGALMQRVEAAERRAATAEGRERVLTERVDSLSASLTLAWRKIESLERSGRGSGVVEGSTAQTEEPRSFREPRRVPAVHAARRLGVTPQTVRRLVEAGDLEGLALRLPDRERRVWVVDLESLERLEREADAVGVPGTTEPAEAGLLGHSKGR